MSCAHPFVKPSTGYRYGCRCNRCKGHLITRPKYKKTHRQLERATNLPSRNPDYVRSIINRVTSKAYGGC